MIFDNLYVFVVKYPIAVIFSVLFVIALAVIVINSQYQSSANARDSILFNSFNTVILGIVFIYVLIVFMGEKITIGGFTFDFGFILYGSMIIFILFVLGG